MPLMLNSPAFPPNRKGLLLGYGPGHPGNGVREARNAFGKVGYGGPCPPKGHGTHHYHFRLFATRKPALSVASSANAAAVLKAAQLDAIEQTELVGAYRR